MRYSHRRPSILTVHAKSRLHGLAAMIGTIVVSSRGVTWLHGSSPTLIWLPCLIGRLSGPGKSVIGLTALHMRVKCLAMDAEAAASSGRI